MERIKKGKEELLICYYILYLLWNFNVSRLATLQCTYNINQKTMRDSEKGGRGIENDTAMSLTWKWEADFADQIGKHGKHSQLGHWGH